MLIIRIILLLTLTLLSHNCLAGKEIITHPTPFYASELPFYDLEGNKKYLEEYENSTVLLVFWATWCGTCVNEMHSLDALARDFRKLPFKVIAVSQDFQGIEAVSDFYQKHEVRYLEPFHDYRNTLFKDMKVASLPCSFLINSNNKVTTIFKGEVKWHDDKIRDLILAEIPGTPEVPRNTYKEPSLGPEAAKKLEDHQSNDNMVESNHKNSTNTTKRTDDKSTEESKHNN